MQDKKRQKGENKVSKNYEKKRIWRKEKTSDGSFQ